MKKMTQDRRLINYILDNGSIDPLTAWKELGIYRLSACVHRLRHKHGWSNIETKKKKVENKFGEMCVFANYTLEKDNV
jgi:hypothetical protein